MIRPNITPQDAADTLNEALARDREAIQELYSYRVKVNSYLKNHPTIQVRNSDDSLSFLGLINGMFGTSENEYGAIAAVVEDYDPEKLIKFEVMPK